jgi:hypothetical protein
LRLRILTIIGISSIALTLSAAQEATTGSIHGLVVDARTNAPLGGVIVGADEGDVIDEPEQTAITNDQGAFVLTNLRRGKYSLRFKRDGYVLEFMGERRIAGQLYLDQLTVGSSAVTGVVMRLTPTGSVFGHVQDDQGKALPGVPVRLLGYYYSFDGERRLDPIGEATTTDDGGAYSFKDIEPGQYIVRAGGVPERDGVPSGPSRYGVVYYPDTSTPNTSAMVEVRSGAEVSGLNFTVAEVPLHRVRGRVVDEETRQPVGYAEIHIDFYDLMSPLRSIFEVRRQSDPKTGMFEILLPSGNHTISAELHGSPCSSLHGFSVVDGPPILGAGGITPLLVGDADVNSVVVSLRKTVCLPGSVSSDGGRVFSFYLITPDKQMRIYTSVRDDGRFEVDGLLPGEYRLHSPIIRDGSYLKEARLGSVDILNQTFTVTRNTAARLDLVLSSNVGQVEGTVTGRDTKPEKEATVVLVPENARDRTDLYRAVATDDRGRFTLSSVAPGDYKVFAWRSIEQYSWFDPEILGRYEPQGKPVRVQESAKETLNLSAIVPDGR